MDNQITLIGSIVIGALLMIAMLSFQAELKEHSYNKTTDLIVQDRAIRLIEQLEEDLRQIGSGVNYDALAVYDLHKISYYVDIGHDGIVDTVHYELSDTSAANFTKNPNDKILYRWSNSDPIINSPLGVTHFELKYYDAMGDTTSNMTQIKTVELSIQLEGFEPGKFGKYPSYYWRKRITPMNLQPI